MKILHEMQAKRGKQQREVEPSGNKMNFNKLQNIANLKELAKEVENDEVEEDAYLQDNFDDEYDSQGDV